MTTFLFPNLPLLFNFVSAFDHLRIFLNERNTDKLRIIELDKQLAFFRGRLKELEISKDPRKNQVWEIYQQLKQTSSKKWNGNYWRVRQEMRTRYKKLNDSLSISQSKFDLLKRKIYEEYRVRIIGLLNSKEKVDNMGKIAKIQAVLERFVQGLANRSHEEAILAKEVKLKQEARKSATALREQVNNLTHIIEAKKGYCSRDPVKIFVQQQALMA